MINESQRITRREAADILGVTPQTIANLAERGALSNEKVGKWWYFSRSEVESLIPKSTGLREAEKAIAEVEADLQSELMEKTGIMAVRRSRKEFIDRIGSNSIWYRYKELFMTFFRAVDKARFFESISPREWAILDDIADLQPIAEIAQRLELTEERVRQIAEKALRRIISFSTRIVPEIEALRQKSENDDSTIAELREMIAAAEEEIARYKFAAAQCESQPDMPKITDIYLSVRTTNCLRAAGVEKLSDLSKFSKSDLMRFRNFGRKSYAEVLSIAERYGIRFKDDNNKR